MSVPPVNQNGPPTAVANNVSNPPSQAPAASPVQVQQVATSYPSEQELKERGQTIPVTVVPPDAAPVYTQPAVPSVTPISPSSVSYVSSAAQPSPNGAVFPPVNQQAATEPPLTGHSTLSSSAPSVYSSTPSVQPVGVTYAPAPPAGYDPGYPPNLPPSAYYPGFDPNYPPPGYPPNGPMYPNQMPPPPPPPAAPAPAPAPGGAPCHVQCPSCGTILAPPPGHELFKCPCGQMLRSPYYASMPDAPQRVRLDDGRGGMAGDRYGAGNGMYSAYPPFPGRSHSPRRNKNDIVSTGVKVG